MLSSLIAGVGSLSALVIAALIRVAHGLVHVRFLGGMASPLPVRIALHLPLALGLLSVTLAALPVVGALTHWSTPGVRTRDVALAVALTAVTAQLAAWHLVAWGS